MFAELIRKLVDLINALRLPTSPIGALVYAVILAPIDDVRRCMRMVWDDVAVSLGWA